MTTTVMILLRQLMTMAFYMAIGYALFKGKLITKEGSKELGTLLLWAIIPCVMLNAFFTERTPEKLAAFGWSCLFALLAHLLSMLVAALIFGKRHRIENFSAAFSNAGFMGIPLIKAALGDEAVFYIAAYVALVNVLQWTYGVWIMTGNRESIQVKKIAGNPIVISVLVAVLLFLTQIKLPSVISSGITAIAGMNAPVAMIILGVYLAQLNLKDMLTDKQAYLCTAVRLVLIPLVTIALLLLIPAEYSIVRRTIFISAAAPVGSNVALYAQQNGMSYTDAVKGVCLSTVLCVGIMPLMIAFAMSVL